MPPKRAASGGNSSNKAQKKGNSSTPSSSTKSNLQPVNTNDPDLNTLDPETPFAELTRFTQDNPSKERNGDAIVFWMRMKDLRISDNSGLSHAAALAKENKRNLVVLHVLSPNDFKAHKRSAVRIDFLLRNLRLIKQDLDKLNIPLKIMNVTPRSSLPAKVAQWAKSVDASDVVANIEYEVDELRQLTQLYQHADKNGFNVTCVHDHCIAKPGTILSKAGRPQTVYSPWFRKWCEFVDKDPDSYMQAFPKPESNDKSARSHKNLADIFKESIPNYVEGWQLDKEYGQKMEKLWPAGEQAAHDRLNRFFDKQKEYGIENYKENRNRPDLNASSRLSPYIASGVVSSRQVLRASLPVSKGKKLDLDRLGTSIGNFNGEIAWRDFYTHVMCWWPRISMNQNFNKKYDDVVWEYDNDLLQVWKEGKTGYPFVDAGMRQLAEEGWMHNRLRMCVAMFLTKDLMLDWRLGEAYFSEQLIDSDLAANNGGWQWSASTGTDPQPYFRVFNPIMQSEKCDPDGDYIRRYVPELRNVKGKAIHEPSKHLSKSEFQKLGYPKPMVEHSKARLRALARFKEPGNDQAL